MKYEKLTPNQHHYLTEHVTSVIGSRFIRPGYTVLDIGANTGFHTLPFASRAAPNGIVHAFEPNPKLWKHLIDVEGVRLWPVAVGDTLSMQTFFAPSDEYHQVGSIKDPREWAGDHIPVRKISVPQVTLDSIAEISESPIRLIKVDAERHELEVFRGARELLMKHRPFIIFEGVNDEIEALLKSMLYDCTTLIPDCDRAYLSNVAAIPQENTTAAKSLFSEKEARQLIAEAIQAYPG